MSVRDPLDYYIEVCGVCGCQLGPGVGSRTPTGRCVNRDHWHTGGVVMLVQARRSQESERVVRLMSEYPEIPQ